jgi:hypothetical protein
LRLLTIMGGFSYLLLNNWCGQAITSKFEHLYEEFGQVKWDALSLKEKKDYFKILTMLQRPVVVRNAFFNFSFTTLAKVSSFIRGNTEKVDCQSNLISGSAGRLCILHGTFDNCCVIR